MFYVWLAIVVAGRLLPFWRWLQRRRASEWPVAQGHIQSVEVVKPQFSLIAARGSYVAKLAYFYSIAGTVYSGQYKRGLATKREAEEFVRDLTEKPIAVHYNSNAPSRSAVLAPDVEDLLQRRALATSFATENSVPEWVRPFLWFFICLSAIGFVLSLWVHFGAVMGRRVVPESFFWMLHVGIFVVWFPAVFVGQRIVGNMNRKDFWKVVLKGSHDFLRYMVYAFGGYAAINFFLFMSKAPNGGGGANPPAVVWRGFSGHWMAFYAAAFAILYSAAQTSNTTARYINGHVASENGVYCTRCGQPVVRPIN
jgi:hypothetical protein